MRGRSHEDSVVESELRRWGIWTGIQYAAEGYSPMSTLTQILSSKTNKSGHKILCVDPPERSRFWEIHPRVLSLRPQRELYEVLVARYALPRRDDGREFYISELAGFLGITVDSFVERLARAKRGYKVQLFPDLVLSAAVC